MSTRPSVVRGRQRFVTQVKRQLAATAAASTTSPDDGDSDNDDLQYVPPIAKGNIRLYSYFGEYILCSYLCRIVNESAAMRGMARRNKQLDLRQQGCKSQVPPECFHCSLKWLLSTQDFQFCAPTPQWRSKHSLL